MTFSLVPDSLAFEQNLIGLCHLPSKPDALREIDAVIDMFILPLEARDPRKALRFESLSACPHFDANHCLVDWALPRRPPQRPMEFALDQFLRSGAHPSWRKAVARLGAHPRFDGSLQRPLLLLPLSAETSDGGSPAYASAFLVHQARDMEPSAREQALDLARALELRMRPSAREAAFSWEQPVSGVEKLRAWTRACAPIALRGS